MRWSDYVIFMTCLTLFLFLGGYSTLADPNNTNFNNWLMNGVGRNSSSINLYEINDTTRDVSVLNISSIAYGNTSNANNKGQGIFSIFTGSLIKDLANIIFQNPLEALLGIIGIAAVIWALMNGFAANYLIPLLILIAIIGLNLFIFPLSFLMDMDAPTIIKVFIPAILNLLFVLAVMDFMRGGA